MKTSTILAIINANVKIWVFKLFNSTKAAPVYKVLIQLTDKCNSRCVYCDIWRHNGESSSGQKLELSLESLDRFFKEIGKNLIWLSFSGGEVTLVPLFKEIVLSAKKHCSNLAICAFTTNGLLPQKVLEYALFIKQQRLDIIVNISLDGDEELHDSLRGVSGNYKRCFETYELLRSQRIPAHFGLTAGDKNADFVVNKYKEFRTKIKSITFVHSGGIMGKENKIDDSSIFNSLRYIYTNYLIQNPSEIIEKIHLKIALFFLVNQRKKNLIPCEVAYTSLHLMTNGDIHFCMFLPAIGNLNRDTIAEVNARAATQKMKQQISNGSCPHCWLNCYSPHSIMQHPLLALKYLIMPCPKYLD